jgi:hypothetical protein
MLYHRPHAPRSDTSRRSLRSQLGVAASHRANLFRPNYTAAGSGPWISEYQKYNPQLFSPDARRRKYAFPVSYPFRATPDIPSKSNLHH